MEEASQRGDQGDRVVEVRCPWSGKTEKWCKVNSWQKWGKSGHLHL